MNHRYTKLSLQCAIRFDANPSSPPHEVSFPPKYVNFNDNKTKSVKSFGIRNSLLLESAIIKVSKGAKIGNRNNQVPHPTQDTNGKVTNSQEDTTNDG